MEKAADDFAAKFPDSELRVVLFKLAMQKYQGANNADKMTEMAQKVLALDPDDPEALVAVAQVLAERTRDTDLDKDQKLAEAKKNAERALVTIDTDVPTAGYPPEKIAHSKASCGRKRMQCWAQSPPMPRIGRMLKQTCGNRSRRSQSRRIRLRYFGWQSRWTCRTSSGCA